MGVPDLCFAVQADGVMLCHAGDTLRYEGLAARLSRWQSDIASLLIQGRDAEWLPAAALVTSPIRSRWIWQAQFARDRGAGPA